MSTESNTMDETNAIQKDTFTDSESFALAQRVAKGYAASTMVPEQYRNNIPNCIIAMELANRIGASIFAVMQKLYIIHGKPAFESTFLIATVNSSGKFTPLRYRFEGTEGKDNWGCRAVARDKDTDEECVGPKVTIKMAKDEGWHDKKGSKWKTMPELMIMYRSAAFWTRIFAPELSLGMHTVEEVGDISSIQAGPAMVVQDEDDSRDPLESLTETLKKDSTIDGQPVDANAAPEEPDVDSESGEVDVIAELKSLATEVYGDKAEFELEKLAKCKVDKITVGQANVLVDVLINKKESGKNGKAKNK